MSPRNEQVALLVRRLFGRLAGPKSSGPPTERPSRLPLSLPAPGRMPRVGVATAPPSLGSPDSTALPVSPIALSVSLLPSPGRASPEVNTVCDTPRLAELTANPSRTVCPCCLSCRPVSSNCWLLNAFFALSTAAPRAFNHRALQVGDALHVDIETAIPHLDALLRHSRVIAASLGAARASRKNLIVQSIPSQNICRP